jgi:hypothetical protein
MATRRRFLAALGGIPMIGQAQVAAGLRAGAAVANITPPLGSSIAGGMRDHTAADVHDELHARALVLESAGGGGRIAFVVCDSCAIAGEVIASAKGQIARHTGISPDRVLVSATHSHSAPAAARLFQSEPDAAYQAFLAARMSDAVRRAVAHLEPARVGWGVGKAEKLLFNRRFHMEPGAVPEDPFGRKTDQVLMNPGVGNPKVKNAAGPIDPDVCILGVETIAGKPLAVLGSYALHYVGGVPSRTISADYFGVWANEMQRRVGGGSSDFVAILANACSGDVNNVDVKAKAPVRLGPYTKMREVAAELAVESERVWRAIRFQENLRVDAQLEWVDLETRRPTAGEVAAARALLPADAENVSDRKLIYAKETVQMEAWPRRVQAPVQSLRIGDLGIATFPGEAFTELGLEVKRRSPFQPTFLIELANSYLGYIPTVEGHKLGGYETWRAKSSYLEVDAAPKLVEAAVRGLTALRGR